jgi:hypothetical protein
LACARASNKWHKLALVGGAYCLQVDLVRSTGVCKNVLVITDGHVREEVHVVGSINTTLNVGANPDGVLSVVAADLGGQGGNTCGHSIELKGHEQIVEVVPKDSDISGMIASGAIYRCARDGELVNASADRAGRCVGSGEHAVERV